MRHDHLYIVPVLGADHLADKLNEFGFAKDTRILDLGCGTGMVAEQLQKRGFNNIDGVDMATAMLQLAKEKGVYRSLHEGFVGSAGSKDLGVGAKQYDAAVGVGIFALSHSTCEGYNDLVHAVKPGGLVCFTIRKNMWDESSYGYASKVNELCEAKKWKLVEKKWLENYSLYDGGWGICCQIL